MSASPCGVNNTPSGAAITAAPIRGHNEAGGRGESRAAVFARSSTAPLVWVRCAIASVRATDPVRPPIATSAVKPSAANRISRCASDQVDRGATTRRAVVDQGLGADTGVSVDCEALKAAALRAIRPRTVVCHKRARSPNRLWASGDDLADTAVQSTLARRKLNVVVPERDWVPKH
jgi:hypothetical protein